MGSFDLKLEIHEAILDCLPKLTYQLMVRLYLTAVAYSTCIFHFCLLPRCCHILLEFTTMIAFSLSELCAVEA